MEKPGWLCPTQPLFLLLPCYFCVLVKQVTLVWSLDRVEHSSSSAEATARAATATTTSVHLAQWRAEERARDEVLVRVRGQPRVKLNDVFEVCALPMAVLRLCCVLGAPPS